MATMTTTTLNSSTPLVYKMATTTATHLNSSNCSLLESSEEELSEADIFLVVLYVLIGTIGIVGNTLVCVVFGLVRSRRSQVNLFIFHQAIVDLCTSCFLIMFGLTQIFYNQIMDRTTTTVTVPSNSSMAGGHNDSCSSEVEVTSTVSMTLSEFMCRVWWARVFLFSLFAISTFNLTTMAIERYIAIIHPFFYATKFKRRHALLAIVFIWLFGPFMQFCPAIFQYEAIEPTGECGTQATWTTEAQAAMGVCLFTWEFILPATIMLFSSVKIIRNLKRRKMYLNRANTVQMRENGKNRTVPDTNVELIKANRNTTMVVITIAIVYVLCWAPNHITFLGFNLGMYLDFSGKWYNTTVFLAFVNSCINPFIYALRLKTFQRGLMHVCRNGCTPVNSAQFDSTATASHYDVNAPFL